MLTRRVVGVPWKGKVSHGERSGRCVDGDGRAGGDVVALADHELCGARHSRLVRYLGRGFGNEATVGRGFGGRLGGYPVEKRSSRAPGGVAAVAAGSTMGERDPGMAHPTGETMSAFERRATGVPSVTTPGLSRDVSGTRPGLRSVRDPGVVTEGKSGVQANGGKGFAKKNRDVRVVKLCYGRPRPHGRHRRHPGETRHVSMCPDCTAQHRGRRIARHRTACPQ